MLTCISLASYTQICPNREEAKKSVCFTFSKPDGTPLTAFRKVPEKIGPGKKYRYQKKILGTVTLCWMHHDDEANYDITLNSVAWTVSLTFCMFYI